MLRIISSPPLSLLTFWLRYFSASQVFSIENRFSPNSKRKEKKSFGRNVRTLLSELLNFFLWFWLIYLIFCCCDFCFALFSKRDWSSDCYDFWLFLVLDCFFQVAASSLQMEVWFLSVKLWRLVRWSCEFGVFDFCASLAFSGLLNIK